MARVISGGKYPVEKIVFTPVEEFSEPEGEAYCSTYTPGLTYTIRPGNQWLYDMVFGEDGWLAKGKVAVVGVAVGRLSEVHGKLEVK